MAARYEVIGAKQLNELGRKFKKAGRTDLSKELDKAIRKAPKHVEDAVRRRLGVYIPGGYEPVFRASLEFRSEVRLVRDKRVTIRLRAKGARGHDRQVDKLEIGQLKHPVFARGPRRTWTWVRRPQQIRPRFFSEPAESTKPQIQGELAAAMRATSRKIMEG